jgi:glycosyltransferase involved in cell wall biosynthesis
LTLSKFLTLSKKYIIKKEKKMISTICLNENYSTTRLLTKEKPKIINNPEDKFESVLFLPVGEDRKGEGGLRTKGFFKKSYEDKPLISIVTVVCNGEKYLEETILSVINQTYDNIEYIIIDGGSTDGTTDIIKKYEDKIDYWVSEKDSGIYDAMNKGIDVASGEWINFMNAEDSFYANDTLEKVFLNASFENIDVIYGNHKVVYPSKTRIVQAGDIKDIWKGSQFCHQSAFIASKVHKANKFNLFNRIGADFEFFYTLYKKNMSFKYIDIIVANYSAGGLSDIKRVDSIVGRWNVIEKNTIVNLYYIWIILKEILKGWVKGVFDR